MDKQPSYIVFQCYGHDRVFHECAFALLSLSRLYRHKLPDDAEVWIYTDRPEWFQSFKDCNLPLMYRTVEAATIKQWRGAIDFVHRVKIEILKDFTQTHTGNILYLDTDIVFTHRIDRLLLGISNGDRYMHTREGNINDEGNPIFRKLNEHLKANPSLTLNGRPMNELPMWNAGVLGFNTKQKALLDDVLKFTDNEYPKFPKHVVEQFAFSVFFSPGGIHAASPYIIHYWNLKEAGAVLASFFTFFKDRSWGDLVRHTMMIQIPVLMQEKINFYQNRSLLGKLAKDEWTPAIPDWAAVVGGDH